MNTEYDKICKLYIDDLNRLIDYGQGPRRRFFKANVFENVINETDLSQCRELDLTADNVWLWSDLHFFHKNILHMSNRPFNSIGEMNDKLVANFNTLVGPNDVSIWGGDISFHGPQVTNQLLDQCNGYKILVVGNHDVKKQRIQDWSFDEIHGLYMLDFPDLSLILTHYPMMNMPENEPYINIHGHLHIGREVDSVRHINMNCEFHDYYPVNLLDFYHTAKCRVNCLNN